MCHYITLVVGGVDAVAVADVMKRHGRVARPVSNAALKRVLSADERQYITTNACDCGTALRPWKPKSFHLGAEADKLRKDGWSEAKIERWKASKQKANIGAEQRSKHSATDSVEYWSTLLGDVSRELTPSSVGLFLHFYHGDVESEDFRIDRKQLTLEKLTNALADFPQDTLLVASR